MRQGDGVWFYPETTYATSFTFPGAGDFGNTGRNTFRGPVTSTPTYPS